MLTAEECLAKADEIERSAKSAPRELYESYMRMAAEWRILAAQADWQDVVEAHLTRESVERG